jgi:hypothetical protein
MKNRIIIRHDLREQSERLHNEEFHYSVMEDRVSRIEEEKK